MVRKRCINVYKNISIYLSTMCGQTNLAAAVVIICLVLFATLAIGLYFVYRGYREHNVIFMLLGLFLISSVLFLFVRD